MEEHVLKLLYFVSDKWKKWRPKMADKDYAPLSTACVRALNDRLYEKRKAAALEIEKMVEKNLYILLYLIVCLI